MDFPLHRANHPVLAVQLARHLQNLGQMEKPPVYPALLDFLVLARLPQCPVRQDIYLKLVKYPVLPAQRGKQPTMVEGPVQAAMLAIIVLVELLLCPVAQELHRS